jgi:succinoglycan biosynthesis protein ExoA
MTAANGTTPIDRVAVIVPTLNEEACIADCLASLLEQAAMAQAEVFVVDGGSTDRTVAIVEELTATHPNLSLLRNVRRLQAAALNLAAREVSADITILVRADAHATYPADFLPLCIAALRQHGASSVVVPMQTIGRSGLQRAIAATQNSRLGNGGSAHRAGGFSGFVEHGHHAAFDRAFFLRVGGYDESFSHNEDAELDVRILRAGGRIWMCREAAIGYFPRSRLVPLARQYFRHGHGRARTLMLHRIRPRLRQLAAPVILSGSIASMLLLPASAWFALLPCAYLVTCILWSVAAAWRSRDASLMLMAPAAITMHLSWATGFFYAPLERRLSGGRSRRLDAVAQL